MFFNQLPTQQQTIDHQFSPAKTNNSHSINQAFQHLDDTNDLHSIRSTSSSSSDLNADLISLSSTLSPAASLSIQLIDPKNPAQHRTVQLFQTDHHIALEESQEFLHNLLSPPFDNDLDQPQVRFEYQNILNCTLTSLDSIKQYDPSSSASQSVDWFELAALTSTHSTRGHKIVLKGFLTEPTKLDRAKEWVEEVMKRSYDKLGVPRNRSLHVIVNPYGGSGQGQKIWSSIVEPILSASTATFTVNFTTHPGHATQIGQAIDLNQIDVVVCVSGDGIVHELINGLGRRQDAGLALRKLSLASIPAGSGNALSANHLGPQDARNTILAALTVLKGKSAPLDLCSVTQLPDPVAETQTNVEPVRTLSFLSTAFGLMADLDVGTESWRWMGETRFILGYLLGALRNRQQRVRLDLQVVEDDKEKMESQWYARRIIRSSSEPFTTSIDHQHHALPELRFGDVRSIIKPGPDGHSPDGWYTIEDDITSIYAGTLPFMAADLLEFPVKLPGDGSIDVIVHRSPNAYRTLKCVQGAAQGSMFGNNDCRYFKTRAFRLTPLQPKPKVNKEAQDNDDSDSLMKNKEKSFIVVDGEEMPYRSIQVELHDGLAKVLCLNSDGLGTIGVPGRYLKKSDI
ncbi:hypothetical protein O181_031572 [Austropuccinia psidii MF-1]|uniref:DAGKc domain-containing protein n=1 Tax=Austropuccinia psidii MF-1 TaxID=1389203 RepID=A0A9Q3CXV7_9BASI|nr:hypothetical protein [Austropuccinia psidii MF-1]